MGGSSEIAYNILPVIEEAGGRVLVRASVTNILERDGRVCGVRVVKGTETHEILAPMVISSAGQRLEIKEGEFPTFVFISGLYNTFQKLLPPELAAKSYYTQICKELKPGEM